MKRALLGLGLMGLSAAIMVDRVHAQAVVSDGTLNTIVTQSGNTFTIDNGTPSGSNLFHSFREFSIPSSGSAIFNNAPTIQNIFSRVTGGTVSNINGTIQASGNANLFLLNPSGILFGANASLNIGGSFVGTTANSIKFADGFELSAVNATTPTLLTISVPIGLQMGQNPAPITLQGAGHNLRSARGLDPSFTTGGLRVQPGKTLAMVGGNLNLQGVVLTAESGRVELGSLQAPGLVKIATPNSGFSFDYGGMQQFGNLTFTQKALVNVSGSPAGAIQFQGNNISLTDGSVALSRNQGSQAAGAIAINATGTFEAAGIMRLGATNVRNGIYSEVLSTGTGSPVHMNVANLIVRNGGAIFSRTFNTGSAGDIKIRASESVQVRDANPVAVSLISAPSNSSGKGANITIATSQLLVSTGAQITSAAESTGPGGNVNITADQVEVIGNNNLLPSGLQSLATALSASSLNRGNAGNLVLTTGTLRILNSGVVTSSSIGSGNAGSVTINASESVVVSGNAKGSTSPSQIRSAVNVPSLFAIRELGLPAVPTGKGGDITIQTPLLQVGDQASITVRNQGIGNTGKIHLTANTIRLDNGGANLPNDLGGVTATTNSGNGGEIVIQSDALLLRQGSVIATEARNNGTGGNITINSPIILGLENSDIIANAGNGRGGRIAITTQGIIGLEFRNTSTPRTAPTNDITASSGIGLDGTVQINNLGVDPTSGLIQLSESLIDPSQKIAKGCAENQGSSFIISGRGGMPQNPMNEAKNGRSWADLRDLSAYRNSRAVTAQLPTLPEQIVQATDWQRNPQTGKVELIAAQPIPSDASVTCAIAP